MKLRTALSLFIAVPALLICSLSLTGCNSNENANITEEHLTLDGDINNINIKVSKAAFKIKVVSADVEEPTLDLFYEEKCKPEHSLSDGNLSISAKKKGRFSFLNFGLNKSNRMVLTLPEKEYASLNIDNTTGDVYISGLTFSEKVTVKVTTSDVNIENVRAKALLADVTTGDARLKEVSVTKDMTLKTTSGDIELGKISASSLSAEATTGEVELESATLGSLDLEITTGDIELFSVTALGDSSFRTTSGNINIDSSSFGKFKSKSTTGSLKMKNSDAGELDIRATTGDVTLTLLSPKNFVTDSTSGKVDVIGTVYTAPLCNIDVTSGDITVRIAE